MAGQNVNQQNEGGLIRLDGVVEDIIYSNKENGYMVCAVETETEGEEPVTVVGIMPYLSEGDTACFFGRWVHSAKYGRQFKAEQFERALPADTTAILRYLASRTIKGIGPKLAQRIVEEFGEDTFDVIENHPDWLTGVKGVSKKLAEAASEDFKEKSGMRNALIFFRDYFGSSLTLRIYKKYGGNSVELARQNPYRLCNEVEGIGFEKADLMARKLGIPADSSERLMSGICYLLSSNAAQNGHVCLPEDKLVATAAELLGCTPAAAAAALGDAIAARRLIAEKRERVRYIYLPYAYETEKYIASKLVLLDKLCPAVDMGDVRAFISKEERMNGLSYADMQRRAISDALVNGVFVLTGGPGTGKTTIVKALIDIFESMGLRVALAAPTGRAAKRMSEATGREAKTVHRLLEMEFGDESGDRFRRNEQDPLEENVIIVDEASMLDSSLTGCLLRAIKPGARLLLIGDADQLPSVGAGNVLADIIESGRFATVRLNEIFRQAGASLIVTNAHAINEGRMPELGIKNNDFFFLPRSSDNDIAATVADLYRNRLPRSYGAGTVDNIQVISPSRRGIAGTENLNVMLQNVLNPPEPGKREYQFRQTHFRVGDRVMQVRNNYELAWTRPDSEGLGVFNGDIGVIQAINPESSSFEIQFDDRHVVYDFSLLDDLEHAYAITVHKSQGSEYPIVIIPAYGAAQVLLTRNLLYTAVTRAQRMVIIVGREDIVASMVNNNRTALRYTGLCAMLREEV